MIIKNFYFSAIFLGLFLFIPFYTITSVEMLGVNFIGETSGSSLFAQISNTELTPREFSRDEGRNVISTPELTPREFSVQEGRNIISAPFDGVKIESNRLGRNYRTELNRIGKIFDSFEDILIIISSIIVSLVFLAYFYGLFLFVKTNSESTEIFEKAKNYMLWGSFAIFLLISIWGIIFFLQSLFFSEDIINKSKKEPNLESVRIKG